MEQRGRAIVSVLSVGIGIGVGFGVGRTVNRLTAGNDSLVNALSPPMMEREMLGLIMDGKDIKVTFYEFAILPQVDMRILVTGGAGFIGSHLVDRFMQNEKNEIITSQVQKAIKKQRFGHPIFELIHHDVTDTLLIEVDQIYHLACPASPIFYKHNPIILVVYRDPLVHPLVHPQDESYWGNVNPTGVRSCCDEGKRVAEKITMLAPVVEGIMRLVPMVKG